MTHADNIAIILYAHNSSIINAFAYLVMPAGETTTKTYMYTAYKERSYFTFTTRNDGIDPVNGFKKFNKVIERRESK